MGEEDAEAIATLFRSDVVDAKVDVKWDDEGFYVDVEIEGRGHTYHKVEDAIVALYNEYCDPPEAA